MKSRKTPCGAQKEDMKFIKSLMLFSVLTNIICSSAMAQNTDELVDDTKNDILVVVGGGLAGAVLGLSTLSFVDEPKEHTRNILMGASIGIIAGVGYVAFSQANKSKELIYGGGDAPVTKINAKDFNTYARSGWHSKEVAERSSFIQSPNQVNYQFTF